MPTLPKDKDTPKAEGKVIKIPPNIVEAILYANATGNRTAMNDVCSDIRAIAIKQGYEKF